MLANKTNYLLEMLLWQNSYNPKKKSSHRAQKPKPFMPEFMQPPKKPSAISKEAVNRSVDDIRDILNKPRV